MKIIEIFDSIQGEGSYMGTYVTFVRLAGCNLHCSFCDTKESWSRKNAAELTTGDIVHRVLEFKPEIVVITGGEPTTYGDELYDLARKLSQAGKKIHLETNGTSDIRDHYFNWVVCSPKEESNWRICKNADELKYVVTPTFDPKDVIPNDAYAEFSYGFIWLQPDSTNMHRSWMRAIELAKQDPGLKVGVQLHKLMEVK